MDSKGVDGTVLLNGVYVKLSQLKCTQILQTWLQFASFGRHKKWHAVQQSLLCACIMEEIAGKEAKPQPVASCKYAEIKKGLGGGR